MCGMGRLEEGRNQMCAMVSFEIKKLRQKKLRHREVKRVPEVPQLVSVRAGSV